MNPLNPLFSIIIFLIAFLTGYIIKVSNKIHSSYGRYESIDGMRGFLAVGVFIHHSSIWHQYLQTGEWINPKSNLYTQLGETSVALFFMVTSFLFISKLLNSKRKEFYCRDFFISRIFRLVPLYYFSLVLIIIAIMFICHWQLNTPPSQLLGSIISWGFFTVSGSPEINNSQFTSIVNAGVVWSLPYEWLFYFSLPLISIMILKIPSPKRYIILSMLFIIAFYHIHGVIKYNIYSFIGGGIAPFLLKYTSLNKKSEKIYVSIIVLICLFSIGHFSETNNILCMLLITIIFTFIALGNSLFGVLKNSTLKLLGEVCYSTYLLHGIILFAIFYFGFGFESAKNLSPLAYSLVIFLITPIVVVASFFAFKYIEKPNMDKSKIIIQKMHNKYPAS